MDKFPVIINNQLEFEIQYILFNLIYHSIFCRCQLWTGQETTQYLFQGQMKSQSNVLHF